MAQRSPRHAPAPSCLLRRESGRSERHDDMVVVTGLPEPIPHGPTRRRPDGRRLGRHHHCRCGFRARGPRPGDRTHEQSRRRRPGDSIPGDRRTSVAVGLLHPQRPGAERSHRRGFRTLGPRTSQRADQHPQAAKAIGVSERMLQRSVQRTLGTSPIRFIQDLRIERASHLLRTTEQSLETISRKVGYKHPNTLRVLLRERTGKPPWPLEACNPVSVSARRRCDLHSRRRAWIFSTIRH
jgi:AraC-like DNA-binding protein